MDQNERMRTALDNIERHVLGNYIDSEYVLSQIDFARAPVHVTSDAVRRIRELTGTSFENALQAYKEGETVEAAVQLIETWRKRHA